MAFSCQGSPFILQGIEFSFQPHSFPDTRVMVIAGAVSMRAAIFSPLLSGVCSRRPVHPAHIVESFTASSRWNCIHKSLQELWVLKRDSWSWVVVLNINYRLDLEEWKWKKKLFFLSNLPLKLTLPTFLFLNCFRGSHLVSTGQCCPQMMENGSSFPDFIPPISFRLNCTGLLLLLAWLEPEAWPLSHCLAPWMSWQCPTQYHSEKELSFPAGMRPLPLQ